MKKVVIGIIIIGVIGGIVAFFIATNKVELDEASPLDVVETESVGTSVVETGPIEDAMLPGLVEQLDEMDEETKAEFMDQMEKMKDKVMVMDDPSPVVPVPVDVPVPATEPDPTPVPVPVPATEPDPTPTPELVPVPAPTPVIVPTEAQLLAQGIFMPKAHEVEGNAMLITKGDELTLRFEDFETINGPGLRIYLSTDLGVSDAIDLGAIRATSGNINYSVPAGTNTSKYNIALVWCEPFGVLFSYAQLK